MLLIPVLLPVIGGIFIFRLKTEKARNRLTMWLVSLTALLVVGLCLIPEQSVRLLTIQGVLRLGLRTDNTARFFMALTSAVWVPVTVFSFPYLRHAGREGQFLGFYTITMGLLMGLAMADNFVTLYMFFEMLSFLTVPLVLHNAMPAARRAGLKYLGYSVFGAGMALAGFFFLSPFLAAQDFTAGGTLNLFLARGHRSTLLAVWFLMVVGFGTKAGMLPMQSWLPDAHPEAPAPASAVLSGVITKSGVLAIFRVTYYLFGTEYLKGSGVQTVLIILVLATMFAGSMLALREPHLKRRLAYSTISQVSYALFGLMLLTPEGVEGALLQVVFHAFSKSALFLAAGAVIYSTGYTMVDQLRGIGRQMPVTMWCFALAALSLIGIPPMGGFVSKWTLASAALSSGSSVIGWAGVCMLIVSALLTAGYLLSIVSIGFFPGQDYIAEYREVGSQMTVPLMIFSGLVLGLGLFPGKVMAVVVKIAGTLCG